MAAPNLANVTLVNGKTSGALLTTSPATLLSGASGKVRRVRSIRVTNVDGSVSADVSIYFFNGATSTYLASTRAVAAKDYFDVITKPLILEENDTIGGLASANGDLQVVFSFLELS